MDTSHVVPGAAVPMLDMAGHIEPMEPERLSRAKWAYTTRHVAARIAADPHGFCLVSGDEATPQPGDVVLARVDRLGQHERLESPDSRRAVLFEGDEILVAYGHRYAPHQFESTVPDTLGPTALAAAGGVAGDIVGAHYAMDEPTEITALGLLADASGVVTLRRYAPLRLPAVRDSAPVLLAAPAPVVAVLGTSMNAGKSTTVAAVVRCLTRAGLRVAAGKVTGTGAGGDPHLFEDSGAIGVVDFTDFGFASTYRLTHPEVRSLFSSIIQALGDCTPDVIVIEVADGLFQRETARLVDDPVFGRLVETVVFSAGDALGALGGHEVLRSKGLTPVVVSGVLTASPMAQREAAAAVEVPVLNVDELSDPAAAPLVLPSLRTPAADSGA